MRPVILLGAPGSGKTAAAHAYADLSGGKASTPHGLAQSLTEEFVRDPTAAQIALKTHALNALKDLGGGDILELSASLPADEEVAQAVRAAQGDGALVVLLDAPDSVLARRNGLNAAQVAPIGTPRAWFQALHRDLIEKCGELAEMTLDTEQLGVTQVGEALRGAAGGSGHPR